MRGSELHDAVFVVGALDEMLMLRGMRYHPTDIETSVVRSHRNICEWSVFIDHCRLGDTTIMSMQRYCLHPEMESILLKRL